MTGQRDEQGKFIWWIVNGLFAVLLAFLTFGVNRMANHVEDSRNMIHRSNERIEVLMRDVVSLDREVTRLRDFLGRRHDLPAQPPPPGQ